MLILLLIFFLLFSNNQVFAEPIVLITDFSSNSDPEWIQLTNNTDQDINLEDWFFKDEKDNIRDINICLSPNSNETIFYNGGWLNNTGGDIIFLYDVNQNLIDTLSYSIGISSVSPQNNNTCVIPTPIIILTPTLTTDSTITNPPSGVNLTEFMPYSSIEWIEIYNQNDFAVKLVGWQIKDIDLHIKKIIPDLFIEANSFSVFEFGSFLNNTQSDKVILYNHNQNIVDSYQYEDNYYSLSRSWSKVDGNWCQTNLSKGQSNNSCIPTPTDSPPTATSIPTPIPTLVPTIDLNRYEPSLEPTASIILDPIEEDIVVKEIESTNTTTPTGIVLGEKSIKKDKKNYLPLILIISGGLLLITPMIITKLKK